MFDSPNSWKHFVHTNGPRLFRYFSARFDSATAADLVQDTLIRLIQKIDDGHYDPRAGDLIAYAFGIAKFVGLEARKSQARRLHVAVTDVLEQYPEEDHNSVDQKISDQRTAKYLRDAITTLTEPEQEVILLLIDQDLTLAQIATITELPLNTVKSHMNRAKSKIKAALAAKHISKDDLL